MWPRICAALLLLFCTGESMGQEEPAVISQGSWSRVLRKVSPSIDQIMNFCSAKHQHGELVCLAHCTVFYGTENVVKIGCETNYPDPKAWKRCFCYILDDVKAALPTRVETEPEATPKWQIQPTKTTPEAPIPEEDVSTRTPSTTTALETTSSLILSTLVTTMLAEEEEPTTTAAPEPLPISTPTPLVDLELPVVGGVPSGLKIPLEAAIPLEGPKDEDDLAEEIAGAEEEEAELASLIHKEMMTMEAEALVREAQAEKEPAPSAEKPKEDEFVKIVVHQSFPAESTTQLPTTTSTETPLETPAPIESPPLHFPPKEIAAPVASLPVVKEHKTAGNIAGGYFIYKPQISPEEWSERSPCEVGDWGEWHRCTRTCGGGRKARLRSVSQLPRGDGDQCPKLFETEVCNTQPCPVQNCEVSGWRTVEWCRGPSACAGSRVRLRTITIVPHNGGTPCPPLYDVQHCANILPDCAQPKAFNLF